MQSILVVGIDVAKEKLDVAIFNGKEFISKIYANTKEGIEKLIRDVETKTIEEVHFVMEATGSYNTKVLYALSKQGYPVYVLNSIISKRYSEEQLRRTTTDKEVSKLLASYGYSSILSFLSNILSESYNTLLSFKFNPSNEKKLELKVFIKTLESLMRTKTRILNQIEALNQYPEGYAEEAIESLKKVLEEIEKEIKNIQDKIDAIVNREENRDLYRRLTPSIKESGKSVKKKGYPISKIGNPYLRQILFMASLSASKHNHQCSILYGKLLKEGKDKKLILIAVAHKLLRQVFAVAKYRRVYDPNYGLESIEKEDTSTTQNTKRDVKICTNFSYDLPFIQDKPLRIADY
jgi:transposase